MQVPHGIVPAVAFRVEIAGKVIVFAGDQNGSDKRFEEFARNADMLVVHLAIPNGIGGAARRLHASPARWGEIADRSGARHLIVSHLMARSLRDLEGNLSTLRTRFDGPITVASDLDCLAPGSTITRESTSHAPGAKQTAESTTGTMRE